MICPHCGIGIHESFENRFLTERRNVSWLAEYQYCSECGEIIITLVRTRNTKGVEKPEYAAFPGYPSVGQVRRVASEVPEPFKPDFLEACAVLPHSAKASAALSRRTMQAILRELAGTKSHDLYDQIEELVGSGRIPSHIEEGLHSVRVIGNLGAHPTKSKTTGEIVDVEPGEAEWNLDVLQSLFDFYFVQPALTAKRKAVLNAKLKEAGKPQLS